MLPRRLGVLLSAAALLLVGCKSPATTSSVGATAPSTTLTSTTPTSAPPTSVTAAAPIPDEGFHLIYGLLTDSDEKGVTAKYIGGAFDGAARLAVNEPPKRIDVSLLVALDPRDSEPCPANGIGRTVTARRPNPSVPGRSSRVEYGNSLLTAPGDWCPRRSAQISP